MFVRFRQSGNRLQASLIETSRIGDKVRAEHVASLGAVGLPLSVLGRLKFWAALPDRLGRLANRVGAEAQARIYGTVHARIPMVTPDEQRSLQVEVARADERFWAHLRDLHTETAEGQKQLAETAKRASAVSEAEAATCATKAASAKERLERLGRGETVASGFEPLTWEEAIRILKAEGQTMADIRRSMLVAAVGDAGGWEALMAEIHKRHEAVEKSAIRAVAKKLGLA